MLYISLIMLNCIINFKEAHLAIAVRKFVHQKDMSEYCRRRVVPSVFLGKHVVDANSQILHFSRLELPYSCSISVRTEFGNNIILVIQLSSDQSLLSSCRLNNNQLLIYELGETFGGYWGALPDVITEFQPKNYTKFYTLKTTPATIKTSITDKEDEYEDMETITEAISQTRATSGDAGEDFIRIDVPLVNISGDLGLDEFSSKKRIDTDEIFDLIYDVTPRNGGIYDTSIIPLVQFSIKKQKDDQRNGNSYLKPRYEFDYSFEGLTPDSRITYSTLYKKKVTRHYRFTKRLKFRRKNKSSFRTKTTSLYRDISTYDTIPDTYTSKSYKALSPLPTINENVLSAIYNNSAVKSGNSWEFIDDLIKSFNLTPTTQISSGITTVPQTKVTPNLKYPSLTKEDPDTLLIRDDPPILNSEYSIRETDVPITVNAFLTNFTSQSTKNAISTSEVEAKSSNVLEDSSEYKDDVKIFFTASNIEHETGSLVNHKSFENVVQAAPEIAVLLNKSNIETGNKEKVVNLTRHVRQKRYIKALDIANARPRNLTTLISMTKTTEKVYRFSDMQDLAQLVELQDDEIEGRVALRYLRKYVGTALFNICEYREAKARQVYLFNSSRIVIAISNFTMERMTLVVTPARTLVNSVGRCPPAHLECQVAGTRVCIDATNACDGVPNCGAYDIYDEDRLRCGWSTGLQHNVCLAACTFLAVLLTMLYTIHYWLKRCVPKVSEAFFIYSDASENTLYLDSIMRSPNDNADDYSKLFYQANIFDDDEEFLKMSIKETWFSRLKSFFIMCLFCKKNVIKECIDEPGVGDHMHEMLPMTTVPRKIYSFTECELRDITFVSKDATVQTGSSLEIPDMELWNKNQLQDDKASISINSESQGNNGNISELNLLKLIRNLKISSERSNDSRSNLLMQNVENDILNKVPVTEEEKELQSTLYEPSTSAVQKRRNPTNILLDIQPQKSKPVLSKRLRFDEEIITIPSPEYEEDDSVSHQSVVGVGPTRHLKTIEEVEEHGSSSNDFMRFWRGGKNKKPQKKSHLSLL